MFAIYLFALIVGGALLLFSLFGSDAQDADVSHDLHNPVQWLSVRTAMYFLFVFGGVGAVLSKSWSSSTWPLVLGIAILTGLGVGWAVATTFAYIRRTSSGDRDSDESFIGMPGRMTLPFGHGSAGKVLVGRGDRTFELLAQPFDRAAGDPGAWSSVVVVEMRRGVAVVAPSDDPRVRELSLLNP